MKTIQLTIHFSHPDRFQPRWFPAPSLLGGIDGEESQVFAAFFLSISQGLESSKSFGRFCGTWLVSGGEGREVSISFQNRFPDLVLGRIQKKMRKIWKKDVPYTALLFLCLTVHLPALHTYQFSISIDKRMFFSSCSMVNPMTKRHSLRTWHDPANIPWEPTGSCQAPAESEEVFRFWHDPAGPEAYQKNTWGVAPMLSIYTYCIILQYSINIYYVLPIIAHEWMLNAYDIIWSSNHNMHRITSGARHVLKRDDILLWNEMG